MALTGRKPKPTHLKVLEGNPGKRPLNVNEPKPRPGRPHCPRWLTKEARAEWRRVVPELERLGLLTVVDGAALATYCQSYARMVEAERKLDELGPTTVTPKGFIQVSPHNTLRRQNAQLVRAFCAEFGLTPSSRGRMTLPGQQDDAECSRCTMPLDLCGCE